MCSFTFKIKTHLTTDKPNPDIAPYLPETVFVIQYAAKKPIQLKTKATERQMICKWHVKGIVLVFACKQTYRLGLCLNSFAVSICSRGIAVNTSFASVAKHFAQIVQSLY